MAEYIDRARALDICQKEYEERLRMADYCGDTVAWNIGGAIKVLPAAEVAEVVRCQNCKHRIKAKSAVQDVFANAINAACEAIQVAAMCQKFLDMEGSIHDGEGGQHEGGRQ